MAEFKQIIDDALDILKFDGAVQEQRKPAEKRNDRIYVHSLSPRVL